VRPDVAGVAAVPPTAAAAEWAVALFSRSVLKQEKWRQITGLLGDVHGQSCLDVGGDNGVISYLLRQRGGRWHSADLEPHTVAAIRQLVGRDVHRIDGRRTPFADAYFDTVVVVDFLEHIHTDREFAAELHRILKPGGTLIVNVPRLKPHSLLNRVRHRIGLTDEKHGHVRPGYSLETLQDTLGAGFAIEASRPYSGSFSETVDLVLNAAYELRAHRKSRTAKGTVVTDADVARHALEFRLLGVLYPALWLFSRLDRLLFLQRGYKLIIRARRLPNYAPAARPRGFDAGRREPLDG